MWSPGGISPAARLDSVVLADEEYVWSLCPVREGGVFVGTGGGGRIYRLSGGELSLFFDSPESDILCLLEENDGWLWAGCSPDGLVYRISPDGTSVEEFRTDQGSIWSMARFEGGVVAGTGPEGKLFLCEPGEEARELASISAANVMSLVVLPDGDILAGGESPGLVQRIDKKGHVFTIARLDYQEVRSLHIVGDDSLALIALTPTSSILGPQASVLTGTLWGPLEGFWASPDSLLLDMVTWEGCLTVVGGWPGRVYCLEDRRSFRRAVATGRAQILCATVGEENRLYLGAGSPACVYWVDKKASEEATWRSLPLDARTTATWGRVEVMTAGNSKPQIWARSGNLGEPDDGWSSWTKADRSNGGWNLKIPAARFAQVKLVLSPGSTRQSPDVDWLQISYLPANQAPKVTKFELLAKGKKPRGVYRPITSISSSTLKLSTKKNQKAESIKPESSTGNDDRYLSWEARDPDGDELLYSIEFKQYPGSSWIVLDKDLETRYVRLSRGRLADGWYTFRLIASDLPVNPPERARESTRDLGPVLVDESPPLVAKLSWSMSQGIRFAEVVVEDKGSGVVQAAISVDGAPWHIVDPEDKVADSKRERFRLPVGHARASVSLRLKDRAGNVAAIALGLPK